MEATGGDELEAVKKYFNTSGFERWNKIYGETDEVRPGPLAPLAHSRSRGDGLCGGCIGLLLACFAGTDSSGGRLRGAARPPSSNAPGGSGPDRRTL
jgi:hypothetical protein